MNVDFYFRKYKHTQNCYNRNKKTKKQGAREGAKERIAGT